ncbi:Putative transposable element, partial [Caligus rogercresseyi]
KRTAEFLADIADTIEASPTTSVRKQAKNLGVSKDTIGNAVQDLGCKETRVIKGKKLSHLDEAQRVHGPDLAIHLTMASGAIPHASVDALKAAVEKEWAEMSVDFIVKTCKAFRPRIEAMLKANGGHFEL